MAKLILLVCGLAMMAFAADLPTKKWLDLSAIKRMVAAAEAEAAKRGVQVSLCIVDESGNLLFFQKADGAGLNTIQFAQSKAAQDQLKDGNMAVLAFPDGFPNQGGVPIKVDGRTIGGIAASGAASEVDEAISQTAVDALLKD